ncbi:hypothetical protein BP6252_12080 [Coleophoma cylindrospora]|uniref:Uncharacterized protein n=1 Tax=Coleophoma cylindrospora TaxID=1849047 RepID=A0A3D8QG37_9HELO|nr:hypothetical protein BP6252_12080 [Coleophoma cylindrospora]
MTRFLDLPTEVIAHIFHAVQDITSGPHYELTLAPDPESYARWTLQDSGPISLASTCHQMQDIYLSPAVAGNLILSLPPDFVPASRGSYMDNWVDEFLDHTLRGHLKRLKTARKGCPLRRFIFVNHWDAIDHAIRPLCRRLWKDMLEAVSEVFGDELGVVICCQGRDVKEVMSSSPKAMKQMESLSERIGNGLADGEEAEKATSPGADESLPSTSSRTRSISLRSGRNPAPPKPTHSPIPDTTELVSSTPLSLHLYFGWKVHYADTLLSKALQAFANKNLRSISFVSDPSNMHIPGHSRPPATGKQLYLAQNRYGITNPWRHMLPDLTAASETVEEIRLDCSLFWSEIAYVLPFLHKLKKLDCELALLLSEPIYPFHLETKEEAGRRILETCFSKETKKKEKGLKKNRDRKWLAIATEHVLLPAIDPVARDCPLGATHDRFSSVHKEVCDQLRELRSERARE